MRPGCASRAQGRERKGEEGGTIDSASGMRLAFPPCARCSLIRTARRATRRRATRRRATGRRATRRRAAPYNARKKRVGTARGGKHTNHKAAVSLALLSFRPAGGQPAVRRGRRRGRRRRFDREGKREEERGREGREREREKKSHVPSKQLMQQRRSFSLTVPLSLSLRHTHTHTLSLRTALSHTVEQHGRGPRGAAERAARTHAAAQLGRRELHFVRKALGRSESAGWPRALSSHTLRAIKRGCAAVECGGRERERGREAAAAAERERGREREWRERKQEKKNGAVHARILCLWLHSALLRRIRCCCALQAHNLVTDAHTQQLRRPLRAEESGRRGEERAEETIVHHRNPLFEEESTFATVRFVCVDMIHAI